jgi:hypothetical protein
VGVVLVLTGCQVTTAVSVDARSPTRGSVVVRVGLDAAALAAVGGQAALAAELSDADLKAEGWVVTGPTRGPASTTVITAAHSYTSLAEASELLADLAGNGPADTRPFRIQLSQRHGFWHTDTVVKGNIDLACGLNCFGDAGLQSATGSATGVDPTPLLQQAGETAAQAFSFAFATRLPGDVQHSNAAHVSGGVATWRPKLGENLAVSALSQQLNWTSVLVVAIPAAVLVLGLLALLTVWILRRRRGRHRHRRRRLHGRSRPGGGVAVTPHP